MTTHFLGCPRGHTHPLRSGLGLSLSLTPCRVRGSWSVGHWDSTRRKGPVLRRGPGDADSPTTLRLRLHSSSEDPRFGASSGPPGPSSFPVPDPHRVRSILTRDLCLTTRVISSTELSVSTVPYLPVQVYLTLRLASLSRDFVSGGSVSV